MKFKVEKGCQLFDQLIDFQNRLNDVRKQSSEYCNSVGSKRYAPKNDCVDGGIGAIQFDTAPTGWRCVEKMRGLYFPDVGNKAELEKIRQLPFITNDDFNGLFGFESQFVGLKFLSRAGYRLFNEEIALINIPTEAEYTPKDGMVEILESEYKEIVEKYGGELF